MGLSCCCHRRREDAATEARARPELSRIERWELLFRKMKKVTKRRRLWNVLGNSLDHTHIDFVLNIPNMSGLLLRLRVVHRAARGT